MDEFHVRAKRRPMFVTVIVVAIFVLTAAVSAQVDNPEELLKAGEESLKEGDHENAVRLLERCIELDEEHADAYHELAHAYAGGQEYDHALESFDMAIALDPQIARHYYCKAKLLLGLEQYDEAVKALKKTVELSPGEAWPCHHLAHAYEGMKKFGDAVEWLEKAAKLDPDSERHSGCLAKARYALKKWQKKQAGEKDPDKKKEAAEKEEKDKAGDKEDKKTPGLIPEIKDKIEKTDRQLEQSPLLRLSIIVGAFLVISALTVFFVKLIKQ